MVIVKPKLSVDEQIEHHVKLQLLQKIDGSDEDGYQIVKDFIDSLLENQKMDC